MRTGKISESILKRSVLKLAKSKRDELINGAAVGNDCALFALSAKEKMSACVREAVLPKEYQEVVLEHTIVKALNNLAAGGAEPVAILPAFVLPAAFEESGLKELMSTTNRIAKQYGVAIAGGQTRVSEEVNAVVVTITALGCGGIEFDKKISAGKEIIVTKWIGLEGTARLAKRDREKLLERYPAYLADEAACFDRYLSIIPEAATAVKSGVCAMHDCSEGGFFGALWELAEHSGVGLKIDMKKIPLKQETVEVCEWLGVNPYKLMSGGSLLLIADSKVDLAERLSEAGIPAIVIGVTTDTKDRILVNEEETRYLEKPDRDELYRYLEE